jgi:hypothetical protein
LSLDSSLPRPSQPRLFLIVAAGSGTSPPRSSRLATDEVTTVVEVSVMVRVDVNVVTVAMPVVVVRVTVPVVSVAVALRY